MAWVKEYEKAFLENTKVVSNISEYIKKFKDQITKVEILSSDQCELERYKELFKGLKNVRLEKSYLTNLEIVDEKVSTIRGYNVFKAC